MKAVAVWAEALTEEGALTWETELRAVLLTKMWTEASGRILHLIPIPRKPGCWNTRAPQGSREILGISVFEAFGALNEKIEMQKQGQINHGTSEIFPF